MKEGFEVNHKNITITAGQTSSGDIALQTIQPVLNVSANQLDFGNTTATLPIQITNSGKGTLQYNIVNNLSWLTINPTSGSITTQSVPVTVTVDRTGMTSGSNTGSFVVNSNGGSTTINITLSVNGPVLSITPLNLDFGAVTTEKSLQISNTGIGSLTFAAQSSHNWIVIQNPTGTITNDLRLMQVVISRVGLAPGNYSGSIIFNTNANNISVPVDMQVLSPAPPSVVNGVVSELESTSANISGSITSLGSNPVTQHGHCWSISPGPTINNNKTNLGSATTTGDFVSAASNLTPATKYYVKAYSTNNAGTSYSNQLEFTTTSGQTATVVTNSINNITSISAKGGGNVTSQGGTSVTARGLCWSTSQNPTIANSNTTDGTGLGAFTSSMTNLAPATTYYVKAYATNTSGTAYGNQVQFTTDIGLPPTVTTNEISNITAVSATGGGNVTDQGGTSVTAKGVCWSTGSNPTISNSHTNEGSGTGFYSSALANLTPLTTYYVRAYATNGAGTIYGQQVNFTTTQGQLPSLTTTNISNITHNSAVSGGNISEQGSSPVTARGVCWSTSTGPTLSNNFTTNGSGTGSFISNLSSLEAMTTYYVRAYATNSIGTKYGNEISFTTVEAPPVVTNGLLSYYTFDNQTASDWNGNNNGILQNGVNFSTDIPNEEGYSASFSSSSQSFISFPLNIFENILPPVSINIWLKTLNNGGVFQTSNNSTSGRFSLTIHDNKIWTSVYSFTTNISSLLLDNQWHMITITTIYAPNGYHFLFKLYIDGSLIEQLPNGGGDLTGVAGSILGKSVTGTGNWHYYNGKIDNARFYNREISQQEILEIYNAQQ